MANTKKVAIIGGGVAGLAAAAKLCQRGIAVTLFEAAPQLGGRARAFDYKGIELDNGQHILLGAYHQMLALLKLAGVAEQDVLLRVPLQFNMLNLLNKKPYLIKPIAALPAPLHFLAGLIFAKGFSLIDKFAAIKLLVWMRLNNFKLENDTVLNGFLMAKKQTPTLITALWEPLCLAALNTPIAQASTQVFLNVLRDSFAKHKTDSDFLLPRVDLSKLLAEPLARYIKQHGGEVLTSTPVTNIKQTSNGFNLDFAGKTLPFSHVILAVAPHQLNEIQISSQPPFQLTHTQHFTYQVITTVYLQFSTQTKLPEPMQGLVGGVCQWVFDRGQICGQHGLIAVIISAHQKTQTNQALIDTVLAELAFLKLDLTERKNKLRWQKIITEKFATFSCDANLQRPSSLTEIAHLYLAGDYVAGDYPATIEGAVLCGISIASQI